MRISNRAGQQPGSGVVPSILSVATGCAGLPYFRCKICCGPSARGLFADGSKVSSVMDSGLRVCAAPRGLPFGAVLYVEGIGQVVVKDRGGAIKGQRLDLYHSSHAEARVFGVQNKQIWRETR